MVKFLRNGIKLDGKLFKGYYSMNEVKSFSNGLSLLKTVIFHIGDYGFPGDDSLVMGKGYYLNSSKTESDIVKVSIDSKYYKAAYENYRKQENKNLKNRILIESMSENL